ncbi:MAG: hypothetical protein WED09_04430 [Homoserinimonas sp.]
MLIVAGVLVGALGIAHSVLGERHIIGWLLRHELPVIAGSTTFAARTIRFAWHVTSVLFLGLGVVLVLIAVQASEQLVLTALGSSLIASGLLPLWFTRGRHLSWIVLLAAGALCLLSATGQWWA